jgi:hypothetical protein
MKQPNFLRTLLDTYGAEDDSRLPLGTVLSCVAGAGRMGAQGPTGPTIPRDPCRTAGAVEGRARPRAGRVCSASRQMEGWHFARRSASPHAIVLPSAGCSCTTPPT